MSMVACSLTQNSLAADYVAFGVWLGLATGAPGSTATPANEATGGGYTRQSTVWSTPAQLTSSATSSGTVQTLSVAAATYTYMLLASASTTGAANMIDNSSITSIALSSSGTIVLTPLFTLS
jgi:hypothetical protein